MSDWMNQEAPVIILAILVPTLLVLIILWLRTRRRLSQSYQKFLDVTGNSSQAIFVIQDNRYVFVNDAFLKLQEITKEEAYAADVTKFFEFVVEPEQRRQLLEHYLSRNTRRDTTDQFTVHMRFASGVERWVIADIQDITFDGRSAILGAMTDLTNQIQVEQALRSSDEFSRAVIDHSPHGISVRNAKGRLLFANESWREIWDVSEESMRQNMATERTELKFDDKDGYLGEWIPRVREVYEKGGTLHISELFVPQHRSAQPRWISQTFYAIKDKDGRVDRVVIISEDTTESKIAHMALAQSEQKLKKLTEMTSAAFYIFRGSQLIYVNPQAERITGYTSEELLKMNFWDIMHPDFKVLAKERGLGRQEGSDAADRYQVKIVTKDGTVKWIDYSATMIDFGGQPAVLGTGIDITELKRTEESLQLSRDAYSTLTRNIPGMSYRARCDWSVEYINNSESVSGYASEEFLSGQVSWLDLVHPDDKENILTQTIKLTERAGDLVQEYRIINKNGEVRWVEDHKSSRFDSGGKYLGVHGIVFDITERKEVEQELRNSNANMQALLENTSDFILFCDRTGSPIFFNTPYARRIKEILNLDMAPGVKPHEHLKDPEARKWWDDQHERVLAGEQFLAEFRHEQDDGTVLHFEVAYNPIRKNEGIVGFSEVTRDVTFRKRAHEALEESEGRYRSLFDHSPDAIIQIDPSTGTILTFNDRAHKSLGYTREEYEKLTVADFEIIETPEDVAERIAAILKRGYDEFETRHRTKSGEVRHVHVTSQVVQIGSQKIIQSVLHDITNLKEAHAEAVKFKNIADNANYGVALFTPDGTIIYVNEAWADMHGFSVADLVDRKLWLVHPDENIKQAKAIFAEALATDNFGPIEFNHLRRDGSMFPCLSSAMVVRDDDGQPLYVATTLVDITSMKEAEQALKKSEEKLRFVLDNAPSFIVMLDLKGYITFASRSLSGGNPDDLIGTNVLDLLTPEYKKFSLNKFRQVIKTGATVDYECPGPGPKETIAWYHCRLAPVISVDRVIALSVVATDITQRKRNEIRDAARLKMLEALRDVGSIDECLNLACHAIEQSELFRRAVVTLHNDKREIANIGYVGLDKDIIEAARQAPPPNAKLTAQMTREEYRLSNSFFIPQEAGLAVESSERFVAQTRLRADSRENSWQSGDELFTPVSSLENPFGGWLSVDTPFDGLRPDAEVAGSLEEIIDIATQKVREIQTVEKLRQGLSDLQISEERLSTLAKAIPAGIYRTNVQGQISYLNDRIREMTGMTIGDMKNLGWANGIHPDDRDRVVLVRNKANAENLPWKTEFRFIRTDGHQFWFLLQAMPQFKDGILAGYVGAIVDITDRKDMEQALQESEKRNATLLSSAPDGIIAASLKTGKHIFANPAICEMTGYKRETLLEMMVTDFIPDDFKEKAGESFKEFSSGAIRSVTDVPLVKFDGSIIYVEITGGLAELDGEPAAIGFFRDITELRKNEKLLTQQQKRLKKLSNLLIELQENDRKLVARELHDSVAQKLALAKIRIEKVALDVTGQDKDSFTLASAVISDAINDLRNISAGLRPQLLDDLGLVAAIKWYIKQGDKAIASTCTVVGREYPIEQYKQVNIFRICQEFVLNAHKHSEADSLAIKLEFLAGQFVLSVTDDGKGFNYDEIIARGPSTTSFGLTNIVERVDIISGRLAIDSAPGRGTRIRVTVPID